MNRFINGLNIHCLVELDDESLLLYKDFKYNKNKKHLDKFKSMINIDLNFKNAFILALDDSFHVKNLSYILSNLITVPVIFDVFEIDYSKRQSTLKRHERFYNLRNKIKVKDNIQLSNDFIYILFDDICTTGSTLYYMNQALINKGIKQSNIFIISFFSIKFKDIYK